MASMEPIPEDSELSTALANQHRDDLTNEDATNGNVTETRSRLREVYTSEQVQSRLRTVPESYLNELDEQTTPEMTTNGDGAIVAGELGTFDAQSSSYTYTYESAYELPPAEPAPDLDPDLESHETTKVTKVTKMTTTRSIRQVAVSPTHDGFYFDANGPVFPANETNHISTNEHAVSNGVTNQMNALSLNGYESDSTNHRLSYDYDYALPSAPGQPHVLNVTDNAVTLVWNPPDRIGDMGDMEGYQVQIRQPNISEQWTLAHDGLIQESTCTVSNLESGTQHQFRVVGKNAAGYGQLSTPSALVVVRHDNQLPEPSTQYSQRKPPNGVPYPPSCPRVVRIEQSCVHLVWEPPVSCGSGGAVAGYTVEYRPLQSGSWMQANDYLITTATYQVQGLRPQGEYEFRVLARNPDGYSEPSRSSGPVQIIPRMAPIDHVNLAPAHNALPHDTPNPPSQPQVLDVDQDWVTLMWAPAPSTRSSAHDLQGYMVEHRELGTPAWMPCADTLVEGTQLTVRGLNVNSTYVFRVFGCNASGLSDASEVSELVQLRPKLHGTPRGVPARPSPPEIIEQIADQVTLCWLPANSSLPIQGYDVEFRDRAHEVNWFKVNDLLMQSCQMTIGDLQFGHSYEFRVIGKNAMGYSAPSDVSEAVLVGQNRTLSPQTNTPTFGHPEMSPGVAGTSQYPQQSTPLQHSTPNQSHTNGYPSNRPYTHDQSYPSDAPIALPDELDRARESPPLPDRDDSPPPLHRPPYPSEDGDVILQGVQWRDPTLPEVLEFLQSANNMIRLNASGYLQHLTYNDNENKRRTMELNGIPRLVQLLNTDVPEIQKNAAGCLRNLSYGRENEDIKLAIREQQGVHNLVTLLRRTPDMQVKDEITGALWNLSSCDALKQLILELAAETLSRQVVVPGSGWSPDGHHAPADRQYNPNVFSNATGVLKNVSAATEAARKMLRELPHLLDSLVFYLRQAVLARKELDTKPVANVICILRNVSFRCQEIDDPLYDQRQHSNNPRERSKSAPSGSPKTKHKLFGSKKKQQADTAQSPNAQYRQQQGVSLLWSEDMTNVYVQLLKESSNTTILEACAGVMQNIAACYWQPSIDFRAFVRKAKGLPILIEILRLPDDRVVCAAATALRNLALDKSNRDLIGKNAMNDLVRKLPEPNQSRDPSVSDNTLCALMAVIYEVIVRSSQFTANLHDAGGTYRLINMARAGPNQYNPKTTRYATQVLHTMWQHRDQQDTFKRAGLKEHDFFVNRLHNGQPVHHGDMTLARPISTQGPERPLGHSRIRPDMDRTTPGTPSQYGGSVSDRAHVNGNGHGQAHLYDSYRPPQHAHQNEPLYAQVHKGHAAHTPQTGSPLVAQTQPAGDSWV